MMYEQLSNSTPGGPQWNTGGRMETREAEQILGDTNEGQGQCRRSTTYYSHISPAGQCARAEKPPSSCYERFVNAGVKVLRYLHPSCTSKKHYCVTSSQTLPVRTITLGMTTNHGSNCCRSL